MAESWHLAFGVTSISAAESQGGFVLEDDDLFF